MGVVTNFGASPAWSKAYREITRAFEDAIRLRLGAFSFSLGPEYVGLFVTLLDQSPPKDSASYKPRRKELYSSIYLDAKKWPNASGKERTLFFAQGLIRAIEQMPDRWVTSDEKRQLCDVVCETLSELAPGANLLLGGGPALVGETDDVWQLVISLPEGETHSIEDISVIEDRLEALSRGLFDIDGHDLGVGGANIFLLTTAPEEATAWLSRLEQDGQLPKGSTITTG